MSEVKPKPLMGLLLLFMALWFVPVPVGLDLRTWHLFAIFVSSIAAIILKPFPMGTTAIVAIVVCVGTQTLTIQESLSSFSSKTVWLIVIAFLLARGFIKTGLGARLAYYFVYYMGKSTLGLAYGLTLTELMMAPFIPSNTARGAGILFPIVQSLCREYGSDPAKGTEKKLGAFLMKVCFQSNVITSAMFMTAMAANPLIATFATEAGAPISWGMWALASLVPGGLALALLPLVVYYMIPPEVKKTPEARQFASEKLQKMGPMHFHEKCMIGVFGLLLVLWVFGSQWAIDPTSAAFIGLALLLLVGVLEWDDVVSEKGAWNTFIWLTTLLMMTTFLSKFGMMTWFSELVVHQIQGFSQFATIGILLIVYFYAHYFFASLTAHVTSMLLAFVAVASIVNIEKSLIFLMFAFASNLSACLTHYGTGPAPVYFGAQYVSLKDWWKIGFILSLVYLFCFFGVGSLWWRLLGMF